MTNIHCHPVSMFLAAVCAATSLLTWDCSSAKGTSPAISGGRLIFEDHFDRREIGPDWSSASRAYRIVDQKLTAQGAKNKPLWLLRPSLPRNARIEFTASSLTPDVDIKAEFWGDGESVPTSASYKATSYVVILGGWKNSRSIIARMDEHKNDRQVRTEPKGEPGRTYAFTVVRQAGIFSWFVDGELFLQMNDPNPLEGPGHDHFAFNNWNSKVLFDDLRVYEL